MADVTRRHLLEAAGLVMATASASLPVSAQNAPVPPSKRARDLSEEELQAMFDRCSNAGRWGPDDELGTLNYITAKKRVTSAALVKTGEVVSVGRDLTTQQTKTNPRPLDLHMFYSSPNGVARTDYFSIASHGMSVTHMDALVHFSVDGKLYNGREVAKTFSGNGAKWGSIYVQKNGIFTRGVLLDVAAARGIPWYQKDEYVTVADFEAAEARQKVRVGSGDAIFVRTGMEVMEAKEGEQDIYPRAGLHAECVEWMHKREVSVYGGDCIEKLPYPSKRFTSAMHMIALVSMGLPILDWPSLTELSQTCERLKRWDYLLTTAPLRIPGATATPINPLCVF
ncbi:MAG TPA: cyclase family protein [Steroidobacteraceae bacterium]|nr:cyclase family protein [Steroidobacteraceae bacterium]